MIYVASDIHGRYELYEKMLEKLNMTAGDCLVVLGDVIDIGPDGIKIIRDIMERENVIMLMGNHEAVMLEVLDKNTTAYSPVTDRKLSMWLNIDGGAATMESFIKLDKREQQDMLDYLACLPCFEEITLNNQQYVLVHTGMGENFSSCKLLDDYDERDFLWSRLDYSRYYYPDRIIVSGHIPTKYIAENKNPNYIFKGNNHIAVDCETCAEGGRLGAICLDTGEEFYVE